MHNKIKRFSNALIRLYKMKNCKKILKMKSIFKSHLNTINSLIIKYKIKSKKNVKHFMKKLDILIKIVQIRIRKSKIKNNIKMKTILTHQ